MKRINFSNIALSLVCAAIVTACGGGTDDEAGSGPLAVAPDEVTVTSGSTLCEGIGVDGEATPVVEVFVRGGAAPYRINTTFPDLVAVSKGVVEHPNESFFVYLLGGCVDPGTIQIVDSLNNVTSFEITYSAGT